MTYVVIGILFVLVVGAGVMAFVMIGTKNSSPATAPDDEDATAAPFSGPDHTPAGDTASQDTDEPPGGRYKRDPVGGEAEGETAVQTGRPAHPDDR